MRVRAPTMAGNKVKHVKMRSVRRGVIWHKNIFKLLNLLIFKLNCAPYQKSYRHYWVISRSLLAYGKSPPTWICFWTRFEFIFKFRVRNRAFFQRLHLSEKPHFKAYQYTWIKFESIFFLHIPFAIIFWLTVYL